MTETESAYSKSSYILDNPLVTLAIYHMRPDGFEKRHTHKGIEIVFVVDGNCETHQKGKVYMYKPGQEHEVINNSRNELIFVCLTIPQDTPVNTIYV